MRNFIWKGWVDYDGEIYEIKEVGIEWLYSTLFYFSIRVSCKVKNCNLAHIVVCSMLLPTDAYVMLKKILSRFHQILFLPY